MTTGAHRSANATVSAHGIKAVSLNDTTVIPVTRALYVGVSGDIKVTSADGDVETLPNVPVGIFPVQVQVVWSTGTTASDIFALY